MALVGRGGQAVLLPGDGDAEHGIDPLGPERIQEGFRVSRRTLLRLEVGCDRRCRSGRIGPVPGVEAGVHAEEALRVLAHVPRDRELQGGGVGQFDGRGQGFFEMLRRGPIRSDEGR